MAGRPDKGRAMAALLLQTEKLLHTRLGVAVAVITGVVAAVAVVVAAVLVVRTDGGAGPPAFRLVSEAELRAMAPAQLAGLERTDIEVQTANGMNVPAKALDARYRTGPRLLHLTIVHSPGLEQVIGFGSPGTPPYDRTSEGGYQRRWRDAGAIFVESLDRPSGAATFGRVSHNFYVVARGQGGVSIEQLRAAVAEVGDRALPGTPGGG
jgi:hypothetical protein